MAIEIWGGQCVHGESVVQGSKNAALPLIAAALLCGEQTMLTNCCLLYTSQHGARHTYMEVRHRTLR